MPACAHLPSPHPGHELQVCVPEGVGPGDDFEVTVDAPLDAPAAPVDAPAAPVDAPAADVEPEQAMEPSADDYEAWTRQMDAQYGSSNPLPTLDMISLFSRHPLCHRP